MAASMTTNKGVNDGTEIRQTIVISTEKVSRDKQSRASQHRVAPENRPVSHRQASSHRKKGRPRLPESIGCCYDGILYM